jgi:type II secretory ATPase GspE/PulE/Tfp pilus assembly ATPase PilB-like protein
MVHMHSPLSVVSLRRMRFGLRKRLPAAKAAHISEALAAALGFGSGIALRQASDAARPGASAEARADLFASRLAALGCREEGENLRAALLAVQEAEDQTVHGKQVRLMRLIAEAAEGHASDVHVTVDQGGAKARIRWEHGMGPAVEIPGGSGLVDAAWAMSTGRQRPSDHGYEVFRLDAAKAALPAGAEAVRLQFGPIHGGAYLIARLIYSSLATGDVDTLGYSGIQIDQFRRMQKKPYGISVFAGPTGSGKSTTLGRMVASLMKRHPEATVLAIEDPPEYVIASGATVPMVPDAMTGPERDEAFAEAVSKSLRQDPDVIMIGEIRDRESSEMAFQAAMTGHAVYATIHANDALSILDRFTERGVERFKVTDPTLLAGLAAQRLVLKLCPLCALPWPEAKSRGLVEKGLVWRVEALAGPLVADARVRVSNPEGCPACEGRGTRGRTAIAEVILPDPTFMRLLGAGNRSGAVTYWKTDLQGMDMMEHAVAKVLAGEIDPAHAEDKVGELTLGDGRLAAISRLMRQGGD